MNLNNRAVICKITKRHLKKVLLKTNLLALQTAKIMRCLRNMSCDLVLLVTF